MCALQSRVTILSFESQNPSSVPDVASGVIAIVVTIYGHMPRYGHFPAPRSFQASSASESAQQKFTLARLMLLRKGVAKSPV
jgi:hypothetical protein